MGRTSGKVPKKLWLMWIQGLGNAPALVQQCVASWKRHNPEWETVILDESSIGNYVDTHEIIRGNEPFISPQALSDIVRINLLKTYGGVWADATCFCCRPLDDWLGEYMGRGFFAFRSPGADRPIASWFLAATRESRMASSYCERVNAYWSGNLFSNQCNAIGRLVDLFVHSALKGTNHQSGLFRLLFDLMERCKVYPYYWFHYLFARLVSESSSLRESWASTRTYSADVPHRLQHYGLFRPVTAQLKKEIDERAAPLYKLFWDYDESTCPEESLLGYLLKSSSRH